MKLFALIFPLAMGIGLIIGCIVNVYFSPQSLKSKLSILTVSGVVLVILSPFMPTLLRYGSSIIKPSNPQIIEQLGVRKLNADQATLLASLSSNLAIPKFFSGGIVSSDFISKLTDFLPEKKIDTNNNHFLVWACNAKISSVTNVSGVLNIISGSRVEGFDFAIITDVGHPTTVMTQVTNQSDFFVAE